MLGRRHLRAKVMQALYAYYCTEENMLAAEKNMFTGIDKIFDLYVYTLHSLVEVRNLAASRIEIRKKKNLASTADLNPNTRFVDNPVIDYLSKNLQFRDYLDKNKQLAWSENDSYIIHLYDIIEKSNTYRKYMEKPEVDFEDHKRFVLDIFKKHIAPNEKMVDWYEGLEISWYDDYHIANSMAYKTLDNITEEKGSEFRLYTVYKDDEDREFTKELFRKAIKNHEKNQEFIAEKAQNWDLERIAKIDLIILELALTELLYFPNIPPRVTLNEYIEVAKDYSTPNSRVFINGILDNTLKEFEKDKKLVKSGRGLM